MGDSREHLRAIDFALKAAAAMGLTTTGGVELSGGNENHVVHLIGAHRDVVLRFPRSANRIGDDRFAIEQWCADAARAAKIPTPRAVSRGTTDDVPVIVHEFVPGTPASPHDLDAWRALGAIASTLSSVSTSGAPDALFSRFGDDLPSAWSNHLAYNRAALSPDDPLLGLGAYRPDQHSRLITSLDRLAARRLRQGLVHGDLSTRNLIRQGAPRYVVIDWGAASVGPSPWTDLERIRRWWHTHDAQALVTEAAYSAALNGAGLTPTTAEHVLDELALLNSLDILRWALDTQPDLLPELLEESRATIARITG